MLRRLSVRGKILATLAVPVLVLVLAASMFSLQAIRDAQDASQAAGVVHTLPSGQSALTALQAERLAAVNVLNGVAGATEEYAAAQLETGAALETLRGQYEKLDFSRLDPKVTEAAEDAMTNNSTDLVIVRDNVTRGARTPVQVSVSYSTVVGRYLAIPSALISTLTDRDLATKLDAYIQLNHLVNNLTMEAPLVQHTLDEVVAGLDTSVDERALSAVFGETNAARTASEQSMDFLGLADLKIPQKSNTYDSIRRLIGSGQSASMNSGLAYNWQELSAKEISTLQPIRDTSLDLTTDTATSATSAARQTAIITVLATIIAVLASVAVAIGISRRITIPLRHLTDAAAEVREQLPKLVEQVSVPGQGPEITLSTIKVESSDEVGQLAEAFNAVNSTTVDVAREQAALRGSIAEMFVNVARRDHVLLNRQLAFLDELERSEEDANTLANLFRLDHLATRMRRNSESLLVLAGIDSGRRVRQPMPVSDVVRTASSEIELYDRIRLNLEADPFMLGHNALNAAHLLAELLENATTFSEPNTPVEVTTNRSSRFVTVEVRDHGLGMSEEDITEANWKVASRSASDVIGVQRLGLFVVGRLADRLGAHVVFSRAADGSAGTSVTVSFPFALFVDEGDVPLAAPTDPLTSENRQATEEWIAPESDAQPVDIAALTDGATSIGMPRRRTAPAAGAPAQTPDASTGANEMVLPALESANPSVELASPTDQDWAPAQTLAETLPAGLPSRARGDGAGPVVAGALEPVNDTPLLDGERRGAMFSNFRTRASAEAAKSLEASGTAAVPVTRFEDEAEPEAESPVEQPPSLVIPSLAPDDDYPWQPPVLDAAHAVPAGPYLDPAQPDEAPFAPVSSFEPAASFEPVQDYQPVGEFQPLESFDQPVAFQPVEEFQPLGSFDQAPFQPVEAFEPLGSFDPVQEPTQAAAFEQLADFQPAEEFQPVDDFQSAEAFEPELRLGTYPTPIATADWAQPAEHLDTTPDQLGLPEGYADFEPAASQGAHFAPMLPTAPSYDGLSFEAEQAFEPVQAFEPLFQGALPQRDDAGGAERGREPVGLEPDEPAALPVGDTRTFAPIGLEPDEYDDYAPAATTDADERPAYDAEPQHGLEPQYTLEPQHDLEPQYALEPAAEPSGYVEPAASPASAFEGATASFEPTRPTFADVVSDAPTRRSSRQTAAPEKRGALGWLRRKKSSEPVTGHGDASVAPNAFPTFSPSGAVPAVTQPAPAAFVPSQDAYVPPVYDRPVADAGASAPAPVQAFQPVAPAVGASSAPAPAAWLPATSVSSSDDDGGLGGFGGWKPPAPVEPPAPQPVPLKDLPLSGLDSGDSWSPPSEIDGDISSMLAMRSNIQEQALAELSQLSSYRPAAVETTQGGGLTRRTRGEVAASTDDLASQKISRDAAELRSRLSAFQSATSRGRQAPDAGPPGSDAESHAASATFADNVPDSAPQPR